MKYWLLLGFLMSSISQIKAQDMPIDTAGFTTFTYQEGDTTFLMKQYFMCILVKGPNRDQNEEEAAQIQKAHMAHIGQLADDRKICIAGPFDDDTDAQGVLVFNTKTLEEAQALANADPAVKAGRIIAVIHPWWAAVGSQLF